MVLDAKGRVFVGKRIDQSIEAWQMPQGGIDEGEAPEETMRRELKEEISTDHVQILREHPDWLTYDLPANLIGIALHGRYRGQRQRWFALRFTGEDGDIRRDADPHPEFDAWRWTQIGELPSLAVDFKKPIYTILMASFARFAQS